MSNVALPANTSQDSVSQENEGVLLIDAALRIIALDKGARQILANPASGSAEEVTLSEELKSVLIGAVNEHSYSASYPFRSRDLDFRCRVFPLKQWVGSEHEPMFAVRLRKVVSLSDAVQVLSRRFHLTSREQIVLFNIALGATGKEAAEHMNISPNTVKSFVKSIMLKLNVTSRAAVIGKLLEFSHEN